MAMAKVISEETCKLNISMFNERGYLDASTSFVTVSWRKRSGTIKSIAAIVEISDGSAGMRFDYTATLPNGDVRIVASSARLVSTPCNFGGWRYWFLCPICERRVGILYLKEYNIECRICANIGYESQYDGRYRYRFMKI